jgi:hypothetical protein
MIPLVGAVPPASREQLIDALSRGLGKVFDLPGGRNSVTVEGNDFPALQHLALDVSESSVKPNPRVRRPGGQRHSSLTAGSLRFVGKRVRYEQAAVDFELVGQGVHFDINQDCAEHYLDPVDAEQGQFEAHIGKRDLEALLLHSAQGEVEKHGLKIESVELNLRDGSGRSIAAQARVTASTKMMFKTIRVAVIGTGEVTVDEQMNVGFRGLSFDGEGIAGKMAAGLARSHLQEWEGWTFPLASLGLGRLRIRDLRLGCRDGVQVSAQVAGR